MEAKRECVKLEAREREFEDESKYTVLFTAGTAFLLVGLKRVIMMFLIEQWRLWVFIILNLVLMAIFFTSMHCKSSDQTQNQESRGDNVKVQKMIKKRNEESGYWSADDQVEECNTDNKLQRETSENKEVTGMEDYDDADADADEAEPPQLSKEELNERAEAFIATFRQHLVLDAIRGREVQLFNRLQKRENRSFPRVQKTTNSCVL
ncbi:hypothetical protein KPL71_019269 [Citrus sinensis]|uniref:Uncharacterized protein n=1 Tax=Citrus sinensis TaxID=2711 RepID=A0ACB8K540_CITSI|nr:hypothetical protein KPL71_019269 [Citrus sinensis]